MCDDLKKKPRNLKFRKTSVPKKFFDRFTSTALKKDTISNLEEFKKKFDLSFKKKRNKAKKAKASKKANRLKGMISYAI